MDEVNLKRKVGDSANGTDADCSEVGNCLKKHKILESSNPSEGNSPDNTDNASNESGPNCKTSNQTEALDLTTDNHVSKSVVANCTIPEKVCDDKSLDPPKKTVESNETELEAKEEPKVEDESQNGDLAAVDTDLKDEKVFEPSKNAGVLLIAGELNWDIIGKRDKVDQSKRLWSHHRLSSLKGIKIKYVAAHCSGSHTIAIADSGLTYSWGKNDRGQVGSGDTVTRALPEVIEELREFHMVAAACGKHHSLCITDRGSVFAFGDNKMGQCGLGNQHPIIHTPSRIKFKGPPITKASCGMEFSMILDNSGSLYSFGCPEYGQLGHNTDGKYFATSNKLAFSCELVPRKLLVYVDKAKDGSMDPVSDVSITDVACGNNHTVAVDSKKRCYTWGFGGYGRLGHNEPKDEMLPRLIKLFDGPNRGAKAVFAGANFSLAISEHGCPYIFGQAKRSGEANMYPKPVQDLQGWNVNCVGCSQTSIMVSADDTIIAWGPSPTHGEQGFGPHKKTSPRPEEVRSLEGIHAFQIAMGYGHSLIIARDESPQDKELLEKIPLY